MSSVVPGVRHPIALFRVCLGVAMFWAWAQETALLPAGATYTAGPLGGGGAVTVIAAVPLFPPLVAVIVTNPAAPPVTSPVALTEARLGALLAQVTTRPLSGLPRESCGVAVSRTVCPTGTLAGARLTVTEATGAGGGGAHDEKAGVQTAPPATSASSPRVSSSTSGC